MSNLVKQSLPAPGIPVIGNFCFLLNHGIEKTKIRVKRGRKWPNFKNDIGAEIVPHN